MSETVSDEEAALHLLELLERVQREGAAVAIVRDGEVVAHLVPAARRGSMTLRELVEMMRAMEPPDEDFAGDLEDINRNQPPLLQTRR